MVDMAVKARAATCPAALNVSGEHFPCDWPVGEDGEHKGWAHTNKEAQAVWTSDPRFDGLPVVDTVTAVPDSGMLTPLEQEAIATTAVLWKQLTRIVGDGPTRAADLNELVAHVHVIQHTIMSQAAARAYPALYRTLGESIEQRTVTDAE